MIQGRCKLDYRLGYLVVRAREIKRVFLDEIAVLIVESPAVSMTGSLIEALTDKKIKVIFCDAKRNPVAELVPHHGCHDCVTSIKRQVLWSDTLKARMWSYVIRDKINKQAEFLAEIGRDNESGLLEHYLLQVEPGDVTNREGHAAKVYFNALFGMKFTRGSITPVNTALNYGYSIIMSIVNREISTCGCLTQLGIFHDNQFNHFNLGCDLMEPFRILIDRRVYGMQLAQFTVSEKHQILEVLHQEVNTRRGRQTVLNAVKIYVRDMIDHLNEGVDMPVYSYQLP